MRQAPPRTKTIRSIITVRVRDARLGGLIPPLYEARLEYADDYGYTATFYDFGALAFRSVPCGWSRRRAVAKAKRRFTKRMRQEAAERGDGTSVKHL